MEESYKMLQQFWVSWQWTIIISRLAPPALSIKHKNLTKTKIILSISTYLGGGHFIVLMNLD